MEPLIAQTLARWLDAPWLAHVAVPQLAWLIGAGLLATTIAWWQARRDKLRFLWHGPAAIAAACVGGAFGGHWAWMLFEQVDVVAHPEKILLVTEGGFSSLGVYAGAVLGLLAYTRAAALPFWRFADAFAPGLLISAALARLSCLFKGCDFGRVAPGLPWAIRYPRGSKAFEYLEGLGLVGDYQRVGLPMHPFPLYEALPALVAGIAVIASPGLFGSGEGQRASGCAAAYCLARAVAEQFRGDALTLSIGVSVVQLLCLGAALTFIWFGWRLRAPREETP